MTIDPFAVLDDEPEAPPVKTPPPKPKKTANDDDVPSGPVFVFDLETIPDEPRFPRPTEGVKVEREPSGKELELLAKGNVGGITESLCLLDSEELDRLAKIERDGKARKGVLSAIDAELRYLSGDLEKEVAEWRKLSFDPWGCRIVALGIKSRKHEVTMVAKTYEEEIALLNVLWKHIKNFRIRCGYNITHFDDAVIIARSMLLGVETSERIERRKFGSKTSIDLMTTLFPSGSPMKLKELCHKIGIVPKAGYEMSGDKVLDLVDAGDWDGIAKYVNSDALIEWELYERLSDFVVF